MVSILVLATATVLVFLAAASALWLGARWFGQRRSFPRVIGATLVFSLALLGMRAGVAELRPPLWEFFATRTAYPLDQWTLFCGQVVLGSFLIWLSVKFVLRVPFVVALLVSLPVLLVAFVTVPAVPLVFRPYVLEEQRLYSGSMCPTLLGMSQTKSCSQCGAISYTPWVIEKAPGDEQGRLCTCSTCWHVEHSDELAPPIIQPDAFVVNKLLTPRRWDLVYYHAPHVPQAEGRPARLNYVKRVIGLPGEEVVIKDGAVWINGERLVPPEDIARLRFLDTVANDEPIRWGSARRPAKLGPEEYFVVGDFGRHSNDSRTWNNLIAGRSPFGLPTSHIVGVVDLRYGPLSRWHVFR